MKNQINFMYFCLWLLWCCNFGFTWTAPTSAAAAASNTNTTEHTVDWMHLVLAGILNETDAASNFVIAPQELLALYLQLHGTDKEIAAAFATAAANTEQVENADVDDAVRNEVDDGLKENEAFFRPADSTITVSNTLYSDVYNSQRFTRKLKNLQFVLHEESDEDDKNTSRSSSGGGGSGGKCRNIDGNAAAVPRTSTTHNNNKTNNHNSNKNDNCNELINAVRINSRWAHNFQKRDTHKRQFYMPQTHTHVYLNAMRKDDIFPYAELDELDASALELSLQRQQLKMLIILPRARNGLPQLLQRLRANVTLLDELCGMTADTVQPTEAAGYQRRHLEPTLMRVFLPKFQFSQRTVLDGIFQQLLNATANVRLHWPSAWQVTQQLHFAVSEDGIGELEPSTVLFWNSFSSLRTKPLMFYIDHPFMFIVHNRQGIQLLGHLAQLHEYE